jgi:hypothetical protein
MCQSLDEDQELQEAIRLSLEQQQLVLDKDCIPQPVSSAPPSSRFSVLCSTVVNKLKKVGTFCYTCYHWTLLLRVVIDVTAVSTPYSYFVKMHDALLMAGNNFLRMMGILYRKVKFRG